MCRAQSLASDLVSSDRTSTLLELARREYPSYFAAATGRETAWLDALVVARAEYVIGISRPRDSVHGSERMALERETDAREREFSKLRDLVSRSATFALMTPVEKEKLSRSLLESPRALA
jgi:hypothetical protein